MKRITKSLGTILVLSLLAACANHHESAITVKPTNEQMATALKNLVDAQPEGLLPEFKNSVKQTPVAIGRGKVKIGSFDCYPNTLYFQGGVTTSHLPLSIMEGRFELNPQNEWKAVLIRQYQVNEGDDYGRPDWAPSGDFSWSLHRH